MTSRLAVAALWALVLIGSSFGPAQAAAPAAVEMAGDMAMVGDEPACADNISADNISAADECGHPCDCVTVCGVYLAAVSILDWVPETTVDLLSPRGPQGAGSDHLKKPPRTTHIV